MTSFKATQPCCVLNKNSTLDDDNNYPPVSPILNILKWELSDENVPSEDERMSSRLRYGMLNFSFARHNEFAFRLVLRRGIALASRHLCERPKGLLQIYRRTRRINISMKRKPNKLLVSNEDLLSWKVGGFVSDVKCLKLVVGKYFPKA